MTGKILEKLNTRVGIPIATYHFVDIQYLETKLLKPDQSYLLGRKAKQPSQLIINHPKISAEHVTFTVAGHSLEDLVCRPVVQSFHVFSSFHSQILP